MSLRFRFLGVSGFEVITEAGTRLLIDPFLSGSPELGLPPSPVALEELDGVHLILVTHGAYDHLGQAVEIASRTGATLCCGVDVRIHALREGLADDRIAKMITGCTFAARDVRVKALEARHVSFFRSHGEYLSAQPLSYLIETAAGTRIYHSGDTSLFSDLKLYGELYHPDVALICVGAAEKDLAPLPPDEAALATDWLNPQAAIPMHFRPGASAPEEFASHLAARRPDIQVFHLQPGETFQFSRNG